MTQFANTLLQLLANLSQCPLHTVTSHYHPVPLVRTPGLKQLSGQPTLHHTRAGQDNTGTNVFKVLNVLAREKTVDVIIKQKSRKVGIPSQLVILLHNNVLHAIFKWQVFFFGIP